MRKNIVRSRKLSVFTVDWVDMYFRRMVQVADKLLAGCLIVLMTTMVLTVTWQVVSRLVLNNPSSITEEAAQFLLIWIGMLGGVYAYRTKMHLGLDIVVNRLKPLYRLWADIISTLIVAAFAIIVMGVGGYWLVLLNWQTEQISAALQIEMAYVNFVLPLSGALIAFYAFVFIVESVVQYRKNRKVH